MEKTVLTHNDIDDRAQQLAGLLAMLRADEYQARVERGPLYVYPVPRGGVPAAYAVQRHAPWIICVDDVSDAHIVLDDVIDSGATRARYPHLPFFALVDKTQEVDRLLGWVEFPWERKDEGIEDNIARILQHIGEDPSRQGLLETPHRVAKAWKTWASGYTEDVAAVMKCFEDGGKDYDEMVVVRSLPFYSHCEHHLAPFFGTATIAYIPDGRVIGLSKLSRVLDIFARRLQVQERLTVQVAEALMEHLQPKGAAVSITARHLCMESRGIHKQGSETVTTALRGVFKTNLAARSEFLSTTR